MWTHGTIRGVVSHSILRFEDMIEFFQTVFMYKFDHKKLPSSFDSIWTPKNEVLSLANFSLRNALDLYVITPRTEFVKKLPLIRFPSLWNNLDIDLRQTWPPAMFKKELRKYFLEKLQQNSCQNPFCPDCFANFPAWLCRFLRVFVLKMLPPR